MSVKWKGFIGSTQYPSLQPLKYPLKLIPIDNYFEPSLVNYDAIKVYQKTYETQANDVFLLSYPKSGNYLLNKICCEIMRNADKDNVHELYRNGDVGTYSFPALNHFISEYNEHEMKERIKWTSDTLSFWFGHTPLNSLPFKSLHKDTKIITIIRNLKDVIVSNYHYMAKTATNLDIGETVNPSIDDYISYILRGISIGGCYFDFYEKHWKAFKSGFCQSFGDVNILFLYYEDIVNESTTKENIQKIATFLGKDESLKDLDYENILHRIDFKNMKKELRENPQTFELGDFHLRNGVIGDWQNYLDEKQSDLIDETMYFKWAQHANDIKYYQPLFDKFNQCNKDYFNV
eukprot:315382_1